MTKPFRYYLRVRYGECDAQRVVFNARYGDYVDLATTEYLRVLGLREIMVNGPLDYQLVKQATEWKGPARFDEVLEVSVYTKQLGNTSFTFAAEFRIAGDPAIVATTETVYVLVDAKALTKTPLPHDVRTVLERGASGKIVDHAGYFEGTRVES